MIYQCRLVSVVIATTRHEVGSNPLIERLLSRSASGQAVPTNDRFYNILNIK